MRIVVAVVVGVGVLLSGCSGAAGPSASSPSPTFKGSPATTDSRDPATATWAAKAQRSCAELLNTPVAAGSVIKPAVHEQRLSERTRQIVQRLNSVPQGSTETTQFVHALDGISKQSDQLAKLYASHSAADKAKAAKLSHTRDIALANVYTQADKLGTFVCAVVVRSA